MSILAFTKLVSDRCRQGATTAIPFHDSTPPVESVHIASDERTRLLGHTPEPAPLSPHHSLTTMLHYLLNPFRHSWISFSTAFLNVLLFLVPMGIIAGAVGANATAVFILNFLAIIPLASILSMATERLSANLGPTAGGLLNATFGNAVEFIVSIIALKDGQIRIVQASMLGSMLSNLLLVLGCCFLAGGFGYHEQFFNSNVASTMSSLLAVASASMLLPATLYDTLPKSDSSESENVILSLSRGTALVLLALYGMYLVFELKTHPDLFDEERQQGSDDNEGEVPPTPHLWTTVLVLALSTVVIAICANYLVGSINSFVETTSISKVFVGLILIPIVGNAGEHATAIVVAWKNKMELAIAVALGSCLQIALFVTPSLVVLGWIVDRPMTLRFDILQTIAFFLSGFVVTRLIQDGKSNYLEGILCLALYAIIALSFFVLPDGEPSGIGGKKMLGIST